MNIEITPQAANELVSLFKEPGSFLRLQVISAGCAGLMYKVGIDAKIGEDDIVIFEADSLRIVADMKSALYLQDLKIEYSNDLIKSGFRFTDTGAARSCGCGQSFNS